MTSLLAHFKYFYCYSPQPSMPHASNKIVTSHQPAVKGSTQAKAESQPKEIVEATSSSHPSISSQRPGTHSQIALCTNSVVINSNRSQTLSDTSPTHNDPLRTNPAPSPTTSNPNHPETHTKNKHQHPGQLHNPYGVKRHTKEEMVKACCLEAEIKKKRSKDS